ncbi:transposase [Metabacillus flavus]|uniref:transposase n=1 Tax=Metabacillus flavus TaxID=2823519 RepID=UPI002016387C|nr:transposase [Metabacillus flavus]
MEIFYYKQDREKYLQLLQEVQTLYPFSLHAYCLMSNHIHLLLETHTVPLSSIIRVLHSRYAIFINHRHNYEGHLFQGRFAAVEIKDDYQFKDTPAAIFTSTPSNPVSSSTQANTSGAAMKATSATSQTHISQKTNTWLYSRSHSKKTTSALSN